MTPEGRAVSIEELRADYEANGIGNLVWHELIDLARGVGRNKPLSTDAGGEARYPKSVHTSTNPLRDDEPLDSTHALVNNFYLEFQNTLDQYKEMVERHGFVPQRPKYWYSDPDKGPCTHWVLEIAHNMESLKEYRKFLRKYLDKTAVRVNYRTDPTVADALVARSKKILEESPYTSVVLGKKLGAKRYFHGSPKPGLQEPTLDDLDRAARRAHEVPRMKRHEGISKKTGEAKRASPVYTTEDLETLLRLVAEELPMGFTQRDLRKIFERLLPSWLPSSLEQPEEGYTEVDPAQETVLRSTVREVMTSLTADEQVLLRGTFDDSISVQDVADILGVERQTVRNRVKALVANWVELLEDPTEDEVRMFLQLLKESVLNRTAGGHDDG